MFNKMMKQAGDLGKSMAEDKLKMDLDGDGNVGKAGASRDDEAAAPAGASLEDGSNIPLSTCDGNKKSLFIGINYFKSQAELRGCINDVVNIKKFVVEQFKFPTDEEHMKTLVDNDDLNMPTRENIIKGMEWLVAGAKAGDSLFFHYSGHGGHVTDKQQQKNASDETDAQDETLCPVDYDKAGQIVDDDLHAILVAGLPKGVRLTAIMDCCHSGSVFDLPYTYTTDGSLEVHEVDNRKAAMDAAMAAGMSLFKGDKEAAVSKGVEAVKIFMQPPGQVNNEAKALQVKIRSSVADVIQFSGCRDEQTSADANIGNQPTGAMSWAFREAFEKGGLTQTYVELLGNIRTILSGKYSQVPQMSTGHRMNMKSVFLM